MNKAFLRTELLVLLLLQAPTLAFAAAPGSDESAIRELEARQEQAWNRHDAAAYANLFTEEGEVVNVVGWWWRGRPTIQSKLTSAFAAAFRESKLTITDVELHFLTPAIAIAHVRWTMTGAKTPPGVPEPRQGIELQVLTKQGSQWLITSFQNTNSVPEVPFPAAPPTPNGAKP